MRSASSSTSVVSWETVQAVALQVIHDAPGCADHDMRAVFQAGNLRSHGAAATQGEHFDVALAARQAADFLRDLIGQFAGWAKHESLHGQAAGVEFGEQRQGKGGGLAAAGFGLRDQVVPGQRERQAGGLDRRHLRVAQLLQVRQHGGGKRQLAE